MTESPLKKRYPLHWAVYVDDVASLQELLDLRDDSMDIDQLDCRGRSPLMLAVTLGHIECAHVLLKMGANADSQNAQMWSVSHVATALKDASLLQEVIKYRDFQRSAKSAQSARKFLQMLADTSDFYCEMGWEFASWLPFVSKICPSDVYKIYKQGSRVRIDTTLLAFEGTTWKRGDQSFIFSLEDDVPLVVILDHTAKTASKQNLTDEEPIEHFTPTNYDVQQRSNGPTSTSYIDMDKIGFERSKTNGILSWISTSDRAETIDGHQCKVFDASNVHLVTKIRVDHLSPEQKTRLKQNQAESSHALQNILSFIRSENTEVIPAQDVHETGLTATEYLDADFPLNPDIGTVQEIQKKTNSFKATLWLAEGYPLDLQEQIMPIVELMASSSAHFARLQNFMRMQLPAGFPVKIEIPLFHLMSAKITFGKINDPNPFVTPLETTSNFKVKTVHIADEIFEIPANYRNIDEINWWPDDLGEQQHRAPRYPSAQDQDDMLLQIAIQQSLRESTASATDNFVLPGYYDTVDTDLAKAIEESLRVSGNAEAPMEPLEYQRVPVLSREDELSHALRVSKEENERSAREAAEAEDELQRVLALSLLEK